jgi:hypothetical protein
VRRDDREQAGRLLGDVDDLDPIDPIDLGQQRGGSLRRAAARRGRRIQVRLPVVTVVGPVRT